MDSPISIRALKRFLTERYGPESRNAIDVFPEKPNEKPLLQGWAIVDNTVGEDWSDVELSLVAGAPQSFIQQLSQPYYARRPVVPLPESVQLTPQTHAATLEQKEVEGVTGGVPGGQAGGIVGGVVGRGSGGGVGAGKAAPAPLPAEGPEALRLRREPGHRDEDGDAAG